MTNLITVSKKLFSKTCFFFHFPPFFHYCAYNSFPHILWKLINCQHLWSTLLPSNNKDVYVLILKAMTDWGSSAQRPWESDPTDASQKMQFSLLQKVLLSMYTGVFPSIQTDCSLKAKKDSNNLTLLCMQSLFSSRHFSIATNVGL